MADPCTRCALSPRHGSSEMCVACLWPERSGWTKYSIDPEDPRRVCVTMPARADLADPVAPPPQIAQETHQEPDPGRARCSCAECARHRSGVTRPAAAHLLHLLGGLADDGDLLRPAPPCCARIEDWWCVLESGHTGECRPATQRKVESGTMREGRRR
jgi:hypothetical protein